MASPPRERRRPPRAGFLLALLGVVFATTLVPAIDTPSGSPEYLQEKFRPRWRFAEIEGVAHDLERQIDRPVQITDGVRDLYDLAIVLVERSSQTVQETLEVLEAQSPLNFIAEPLRLVIETKEEERERRRRPVQLSLRDYGLFFKPQTQTLFVNVRSHDETRDDSIGSSFDFGGDEEVEPELPFELRSFLDELAELGDGESDSAIRGTGALLLRLTPEEEQAIRTVLERSSAARFRQLTWKVHFGFLSIASETSGGILPAEELPAVLESLDERRTRTITVSNGARGSVQIGAAERRVHNVEANQTGRFPVLNPVLSTPLTIQSLHLTAFEGRSHTLLSFDAFWHQLLPKAKTSTIIAPRVTEPGVSTGSNKDGQVRISTSPPSLIPGSKYQIHHNVLDRWDPAGDVFVPHGSGLVLLGTIDGKTAAIILEEVGR